jgi:hypothetical protein
MDYPYLASGNYGASVTNRVTRSHQTQEAEMDDQKNVPFPSVIAPTAAGGQPDRREDTDEDSPTPQPSDQEEGKKPAP